MSLLPAAVRSQVAFNERVMERYVERDAQIEQALLRAHHTLATVQAEVAALTAEQRAVRSWRSFVELETQQLLLSWHMQTLPSEILRMIFLHLRASTGTWDPALTQWTLCRDIMKVPFTLASVSRSWRAVALDCSALWAFICPPPPSTTSMASPSTGTVRLYIDLARQEACLACVQLLLQRSKNLTLDLIYLFHNRDALALLASDAHRWRSFTFAAPINSHGSMSILRRPFVELQHLVITSPTGSSLPWIVDGYPRYMLVAPKLCLLWSMDSNFLLLGPRPTLQTLIILELRIKELPLRVVVDMLRLVPALLHLRLEVASMLHEHPLARVHPVRFHRLQYLALWPWNGIDPRIWTHVLDTPSVTDLRTYSSTFPLIAPFVSRIAETLEELHLESAEVDGSILVHLKGLKKLTMLYFSHTVVADEVFKSLAQDSSLLPNLHTLALEGSSRIEPDFGDGLVQLINSRQSPSAAHSAAQITTVALSSPEIQTWLKAQVEHLLSH